MTPHPCIVLKRFLLVVAAMLLACESPAAPRDRAGLETAARAGQIEITNRTERPVFVFVIGREASALALWGPCVDAVKCPPLAPGARRFAPYPAGEREALVNWWYAVIGPDGRLRPDSIRVSVVDLDD